MKLSLIYIALVFASAAVNAIPPPAKRTAELDGTRFNDYFSALSS
jgi:hypothetical protein